MILQYGLNIQGVDTFPVIDDLCYSTDLKTLREHFYTVECKIVHNVIYNNQTNDFFIKRIIQRQKVSFLSYLAS